MGCAQLEPAALGYRTAWLDTLHPEGYVAYGNLAIRAQAGRPGDGHSEGEMKLYFLLDLAECPMRIYLGSTRLSCL